MRQSWIKTAAGALLATVLATATLAQSLVLPAPPESRKITVVVDRGITHTRQLRSPHLRYLRKQMVGKAAMAEADLRKLADAKDSLAALKMVKLLRTRDLRKNASDMAFYASIAAGAGRKGMLKDFIEALYLLDPKTEPKARISQYIRILYGHAWAGNTMAQDAMIALNGPGQLFGPMGVGTRERIVAQAADNHGRLVLSLAITDLGREGLTAGDLTRVIGYLTLAERHGDPALRTMAHSLRMVAEARRAAQGTN